ncbi:hypothetical protein PV08_02387 [Exophiala spinifera]|uniref:Uncharacterized protein n=1 Tax=Exophiala spinifera TaxID=91928 RepID=A0A0D2BHL3_9EURO|nr:uncharacterized protein PV08_02387 [Exophiala spinifera]KIW18100.1 hypothetical protein PV08_02387 [Exophiala spinifera]
MSMSMSTPATPSHKMVGELFLVSPMSVVGSGGVSGRKRKITPVAERASPKRIAVITSPGAVSPAVNTMERPSPNPLAWPIQSERASIEYRSSLGEAIPNPLYKPEQASPPPRHIVLPFDLRVDEKALSDPDKRALLSSIFPHTTTLTFDGNFIAIHVDTLPPKPWPLSVAGVPLYLYQERGRIPMPEARPAWESKVRIGQDQNGRNMKDWTPLFNIIKDHCRDIGVSITEVIYFPDSVYIVLEHRDTDYKILPRLAGGIMCFYMFEDQMGRPSTPQARRLHDPAPGDPDVSKYDALQPGLRVSSAYLPDKPDKFLGTTTGVLVKDQVGNKFMTVAAHGFPPECGTSVYHALPSTGRDIGELIMEVTHTDIALVKLQDEETFSNTTFQNDLTPEPVQLKKFVRCEEYQRQSIIHLDSPDTGFIDGQYMAPSYKAIPVDEGLPKLKWVSTTWYYMGEDSGTNLPAGMCGSAIWDEDGNVLGFFKYAPLNGAMVNWCNGVAADELINRGYTLVDANDTA